MLSLSLVMLLVVSCEKAPTTGTVAPTVSSGTVGSGKLTIAVSDLGDELFDTGLGVGGNGSQNYGRVLGGYLLASNERGENVPGIASAWSVAADGLTWTFTIRDGVKFHDGSALTAKDVVWSLQHYFGPQALDYVKRDSATRVAKLIASIEPSGTNQVRVITKEPYPALLEQISESGTGSYFIMPARAALHDVEAEKAFQQHPISAGPMKLVEYKPGLSMKFERFEDFYYQPKYGLSEDRRVKFQTLDMVIIPEEATRVAAIRGGQVDIAPVGYGTINQVKAAGATVAYGQEGVIPEMRFYGCWSQDKPCFDKRVRQALDYSVNKVALQQLLGGPDVYVLKGWYRITPSTIGYTPEMVPYPFDAVKARQLLADAGYPGGKGFGKLVLNTQSSAAIPLMVDAAQLIANTWKTELGLDVEVKVWDPTALKDASGKYKLDGQVVLIDNGTRREMTGVYRGQFYTATHPERFRDDPALNRRIDAVASILDEKKLGEAAAELFKVLRDEDGRTGFGYLNIPWALASRVQTYAPFPLFTHPSALHTITLRN